MAQKPRAFEYRGYWLDKRPGGASPFWYVTWLDRAARQTRRVSLGTADLHEAKDRLVAWVMEYGTITKGAPKTVTVAQCLERYWHRHAKNLPSAEQAAIASRQIITFWQDATVADLTPQRQHEFIAWLRESREQGGRQKTATTAQPRSNGTISRILSVLRAALNDAEKFQELTQAPFIFDVPKGQPRERVLTAAEIARLLDAADADYLRAFIWLAIGTGARKGAILELTRFQCDLEQRRIRLNPEGRAQNAKRRPDLPICNALAPIIRACPGPYLVQHEGKRLKDVKAAWRRAAATAGFGADVTPHTLRHTVATELRRRGVSESECAGFLGHRWSNKTTERYAKWRPDHLGGASAAIDAFMNEIGRLWTQPANVKHRGCVTGALHGVFPCPKEGDGNP
ncbi:site-specific integrase [Geminicoccaceae bacterium 1502E]|nr:site-specific integrase [Geminicoccaceae bacterium 1502E]